MKSIALAAGAAISCLATGCGTLEKKAALIDVGDSKQEVIALMGPPDDRQATGRLEALQYCQTGAGFGYNDYRVIWIQDGVVSGFNSYKSSGTTCKGAMREVRWEDAPDVTVEVRQR